MYQALYRKWRPRSFEDVVGQEHITETLKRQLVAGRLSHAYLFVGTRGTGKTTCAKILARAVNCERPVDGNPCNQCASCIGIESGAIMDVEELDAASNNGVENIRAIREEAVFTPASVRKRVYIIDEVHMLSMSAFNALLKILEEPPAHLIFILATTEINKVPATILSRCQRFSFKRIGVEDISRRLNFVAGQEGLALTQEASDLLSRLADGSMRDALSLLDQCSSEKSIDAESILRDIGLAGTLETEKLLNAIAAKDMESALEIFYKLYTDGKKLASLLGELILLERDILMTKVAPSGGKTLLSGSYSAETITRFSQQYSASRLVYGINLMMSAQSDMQRSADVKTTAEICIMKLCDETLSDDVSALRARVSHLEEKLSGATITSAPDNKLRSVTEVLPAEKTGTAVPEAPHVSDEPLVKTEEQPITKVPPEADKKTGHSGVSDSQAWSEILKTAEPKLDIPQFMFLNDKVHSEAEISESRLTVRTKSAIANSMLSTTAVNTVLKTAAEAVLGRSMTVSVSEFGKDQKTDGDKLDSLKRFNNIIFE